METKILFSQQNTSQRPVLASAISTHSNADVEQISLAIEHFKQLRREAFTTQLFEEKKANLLTDDFLFDSWDAISEHVVFVNDQPISGDDSLNIGFVGLARISFARKQNLPFSKPYRVYCSQDDIEVGRVAISPKHRKGLLSVFCLLKSFRMAEHYLGSDGRLWIDPIVRTKDQFGDRHFLAMGFTPATEVKFFPNWGCHGQAFYIEQSEFGRIWDWRDAMFSRSKNAMANRILRI